MEYTVMHRGVVGFENMNFKFDVLRLTSSVKNRSYPNLSNCCHEVLQQKKFCKTCNKEVTELKELKFKRFKLGKENFDVSAEHLKQIKDSLDDDRIIINEYRDRNEIKDKFYTDVLFTSKQHKKYKKEYLEFLELLHLSGKVAIGTMSYNSRPYPVMIHAEDGHIHIRALHFEDELKDEPMLESNQINNNRVKLLNVALRISKNKQFDMGKFVNTRDEEEEKLIEKVINGEKLPEPELTEVKSFEEDAELARLQELIKANGLEIEVEVK